MKYPNWKGPENEGRIEALLNIVGEPNAEAALRGDVVMRFEPAPHIMFDGNGRRIPRNLKAAVCDADRSFHLVQPEIDFEARIKRLRSAFSRDILSLADFQNRASVILDKIRQDKAAANILRGIWLPVCIPGVSGGVDYGKRLDEYFLSAVETAYTQEFPERPFVNHRKGTLEKNVKVVKGSRHDQLVSKLAEGPVVAIYFPNPLQGFSVHAAREQMAALPDSFLLAGGFNTLAAVVMYPDVLARDWNTPGLDCAALSWRGGGRSLYFRAFGGHADFDDYSGLGDAFGSCSAGLLVLG